jgi:hypothetical protein
MPVALRLTGSERHDMLVGRYAHEDARARRAQPYWRLAFPSA